MLTRLLFFLLLFPIITVAQVKRPPADLPRNPEIKASNSVSRNGYTVEIPLAWSIDTSGTMGTDLIAFLPKTSEDDNFSENLNIIIQDLKGMDIDLKKFTEISVKQVKSMVGEDALTENEFYQTDAGPYHKLVYNGKIGMLDLTTIQHFFVRNEKAYIITFSIKKNETDSYKNLAEQVMNTFRIK
ncbi:MAG: hypothetical protein R2850_00980 [Bacteroidia bacterium]